MFAGLVLAAALNAATCADLNPADYWKRDELFKVPSYRANPYPESESAGMKAMLVKGKGPQGAEAEFFAYYAKPEGPMPAGGWPGMVLVHGGGGTAFPQFVRQFVGDGFAVIALDWYNQRPAPALTNAPPTETNVPRCPLAGGKRQDHVANVANMVLAHSLLRSFAEVNAAKTVYVGLSWGSWYGSCVTAVDDRFAGGVMIYLCDRSPRGSAVPTNHGFVCGPFHKSIKVPLWWIVWPKDPNGDARSLQAGWDACPPAMFRGETIVANLGHSHEGFKVLAVRRMAKYFAGMAPRVPQLSRGTYADGVLTAKIEDAGLGVTQAKLWYSTDELPARLVDNKHTRWADVPAEIVGDAVRGKVPEGATMAYLTAYEAEQPDSRRQVYAGSSGFYMRSKP